MESCCCPEKPDSFCPAVRCPDSDAVGHAVDRHTVKALLTGTALQRLPAGDFRFCPDADCDVVYFGVDGARFSTLDVRVEVWQKRPSGHRPVCYCFGESEASIRAEVETTGRSTAVERIREHIAEGRCACDVRNPRGACCLSDVTAAIMRVEEAVRSDTEKSNTR